MALLGVTGACSTTDTPTGCTCKKINRCESVPIRNSVAGVLMVWCGDCNAADYRLEQAPNGA